MHPTSTLLTPLPPALLFHPAPPYPAVNQTADKAYYFFDGYAHFAAGLACGLAGLGAGMAIGIVGDAGVRANAQQPKLFVGEWASWGRVGQGGVLSFAHLREQHG